MSISLSKSNVLISKVPTITDAGTNEIAANISDPDHSLNYTCGTGATNFSVSYGANSNISYVGISGHTAATPANATIQLFNGTTLIDSVALKRNNNVMFTFPLMTFTDLIVKFVTVPANFQMTVSFIAAGDFLSIAVGSQSGYGVIWLNRHTQQRTTTNLQVGPIASTQKSMALKGSLSFPNSLASFTQDEWQDFLDFSFEQPFFIKEIEEKPESTYICYDPMPAVKVHSQTRNLAIINLKFMAFNGL